MFEHLAELNARDAVRNAVQRRANLRQFISGGRERVEIRRVLRREKVKEADPYMASQFSTHAKSGHCALARANHVFGTDEKRIRTKNMVMDKSNYGLGLLLPKIADCVRIRFSSAHNRRSARTGRRPRKRVALQRRRYQQSSM